MCGFDEAVFGCYGGFGAGGVYVSRRELVKDALRRLFRHYGIEPFGAEEPEEAGEEAKAP